MTIKLRKGLYWLFLGLSSIGLALSAVLALGTGGAEKARAFYPMEPIAYYTMIVNACACGLYAAVVTGLVAAKLGRTVSIEMFFFALWAFCQALELGKLAPVALAAGGLNYLPFSFMTRFVLFGRYLGVMSLFVGSVFAVGLRQERAVPLFGIVCVVSLFFAAVTPLNSGGVGADMLAERGFKDMTRSFELAIIALSACDYAVAWRMNKDAVFLFAGIGAVLCAIGSAVWRLADVPLVALVACATVVAGTWFHAKSLYDRYLWR